jgi:tetratricopeptide (TPR) repeat protein
MRKLTILCTLICLGFIAAGQSGEEENVKKAIQAKMDAAANGNLEGRKAAWQHDAKVSTTFISHDGYSTVQSWDSLAKMMEQDVKQNPNPGATAQVKLENFSIHANGDLAFAAYDRVVTPSTDQSTIFPYTGVIRFRDYEMLVRENGQWKTSTRIVTSPGSYNPNGHAAEIDLNTAGYDLLAAKKINEAIEVFKLNVKLHPDSWNVYDSLGEAYAAAGNKKDAIANYEKSIQLNPKSDSGKEVLAKLKAK